MTSGNQLELVVDLETSSRSTDPTRKGCHVTELVNVEEAAEMTRLSPATVRWLIHQERFAPSAKIGRRRMFRRQAVLDWVQAQFDAEAAKVSA